VELKPEDRGLKFRARGPERTGREPRPILPRLHSDRRRRYQDGRSQLEQGTGIIDLAARLLGANKRKKRKK
jgi:hypothetical protein